MTMLTRLELVPATVSAEVTSVMAPRFSDANSEDRYSVMGKFMKPYVNMVKR
jgi:hypothetical protein